MNLKKELNLLDVFCISTGAMLSGLFLLPGLAYSQAGPAVLVSYLLAALAALTGLLSQAELASAMPKAGGTYFYVTRSLGSAVGTVYGMITWLALILKSAYELLFMAMLSILALEAFDIHINVRLLAVIFCVLFMGINLLGAKEAGRVQVYLVMVLLGILVYFCFRCGGYMDAHNFEPFAPHGLGSILGVSGFVFISFGGLLKVASIAEEVKDPGRAIPLGMILSLVVIVIIYIAVVFVLVAVRGGELAGSKTPLSDVAGMFPGTWSVPLMTGAAILAIVTAVNSGIMAASRYPLALARDEMLPAALAKINHRFRTPHYSILLTGIIIIAAFFIDVTKLVKAASSILIMTYIFTCLAVLILRESKVQNYQPKFRSPLYPWLQLFGIIVLGVLMFEIGAEALFTSCLLMVIGFVTYWFYGRSRANREYALLHLIERITARELTTHQLETELKDIIHERDEVLKDRFDHLIESCPVLDISEAINLEDFFGKAADALAEDLALSREMLLKLFLERENESSTVLNPFLAIPHIIIDGDHHFSILLARCREGIIFSPPTSKVHTVFFLVGTKDERPFHLQSLAAICQIVQDPNFENLWMNAKSTQALRDVIALGKRKRQ